MLLYVIRSKNSATRIPLAAKYMEPLPRDKLFSVELNATCFRRRRDGFSQLPGQLSIRGTFSVSDAAIVSADKCTVSSGKDFWYWVTVVLWDQRFFIWEDFSCPLVQNILPFKVMSLSYKFRKQTGNSATFLQTINRNKIINNKYMRGYKPNYFPKKNLSAIGRFGLWEITMSLL